MERLVVGAALAVVAVVVALVIQRRPRDPPTQPRSWSVPAQLARGDFLRPEAPWLVVLFSSVTCATCHGVAEKMRVLECDAVAVQEVEVANDRALTQRYGIEAVPTVVVADGQGVVRASFVGPVTSADLWATLAEVREPGSVPPGCDHGVSDSG